MQVQYTIYVCFWRLFLVCICLFVFTKYMYFDRGELTSFFFISESDLKKKKKFSCFGGFVNKGCMAVLSACYNNFK